MSIVKAVTGEVINIETWFRDTNGQPRAPLSNQNATFAVRDFNNGLVASGAGTQDGGDPSRWMATFTLPSNAPISLDGRKKYSLIWSLPVASGPVTTTEFFDVFPDGDPIRRLNDTDVVTIHGTPFADSVYVDVVGAPAITQVTFGIVDEVGTMVMPLTPITSYTTDGTARIYSYMSNNPLVDIPDLAAGAALMTFLGMWTVVRASGAPEYHVHPIYVVNPVLLRHTDSLQKLVDRAKTGDAQPHLEIKQTDLIHHLYRGIEHVVAYPPNYTPITPVRMPGALADFIVKAGAVSLLKAMYLAEGMSNFDFQGLGVQLVVDRTPYIDNMITRLENDIGDPLRIAKSNWIRQGCPSGPIGGLGGGRSPFYNRIGAMNVSTGAFTNVVSAGYAPYVGAYFGPSSLWRGFSPINGFAG